MRRNDTWENLGHENMKKLRNDHLRKPRAKSNENQTVKRNIVQKQTHSLLERKRMPNIINLADSSNHPISAWLIIWIIGT